MAYIKDENGNQIDFTDNLEWTDEYNQKGLVGQVVDLSLTGAMLFQESSRIFGRKITLRGGDGVYVKREVVQALSSEIDVSKGKIYTLGLSGGRQFSVKFDLDRPLESEQLNQTRKNSPDNDSLYTLNLAFIIVG